MKKFSLVTLIIFLSFATCKRSNEKTNTNIVSKQPEQNIQNNNNLIKNNKSKESTF